MKRLLLLSLILVLLLSSLFFSAFTTHASVTSQTFIDPDGNLVNPVSSPVRITADITVSDECEGLATRFVLNQDDTGVLNAIASGAGDQTITLVEHAYSEVGTYYPTIYYFLEGANYDNLAESCSSAYVFVPDGIEINAISVDYPQGYNVSFSTLELLYWILGTAFVIYMVLRLAGTLIGNRW